MFWLLAPLVATILVSGFFVIPGLRQRRHQKTLKPSPPPLDATGRAAPVIDCSTNRIRTEDKLFRPLRVGWDSSVFIEPKAASSEKNLPVEAAGA